MEDSIELGVDIRVKMFTRPSRFGDGDRIEFWVVSTNEPDGQVMLCLIAVPKQRRSCFCLQITGLMIA